MPDHVHARHTFIVDAPVDQAFMYFTPAGEELWVKGWHPRYVHPSDGRTEAGMVFTTGEGDDLTIWTMTDFDRSAHRSRYVRCTPATRTGIVEVCCSALDHARTEVTVSYRLTALNAAGSQVLEDFVGERFAAMIEDWGREIAARREALLTARIA